MKTKDKAMKLGDLLASNLPPSVVMAMTISDLVKFWACVAGPGLGGKSRPVLIERDSLVVICENPSAAKVLSMKRASLAEIIERRWNLGIKDIRPVVGKIEAMREVPDRKARKIKASPSVVRAFMDYTSEKIDRPDVAEALAKLMATYMERFPKSVSRETKKP